MSDITISVVLYHGGNKQDEELFSIEMGNVPRVGEIIVRDDVMYEVKGVAWNFNHGRRAMLLVKDSLKDLHDQMLGEGDYAKSAQAKAGRVR